MNSCFQSPWASMFFMRACFAEKCRKMLEKSPQGKPSQKTMEFYEYIIFFQPLYLESKSIENFKNFLNPSWPSGTWH